MRVLHGQVTVQGYVARPSLQFIDLYAPYNHQALLIETFDPLHAELAYVKRQVAVQENDEQDALTAHVMTYVDKKHAAVIALRAMVDESNAYQSRALFKQLFEYPARRVNNADDAEHDATNTDFAYDPLQIGGMHVVSRCAGGLGSNPFFFFDAQYR